MNRSKLREETFKLLYSLEFNDEDVEGQINYYIESNSIVDNENIEFIKNTINGIEKNKDNICEIISKHLASKWTIDRISKIDLSILKLAIYEIKNTDIPYKVAINEAVELAKLYGNDNSKSFVNGILASVVNEK